MNAKLHQCSRFTPTVLIGLILGLAGSPSHAAPAAEQSSSPGELTNQPTKAANHHRKVTLAKVRDDDYPTKPQQEVRTLRQK